MNDDESDQDEESPAVLEQETTEEEVAEPEVHGGTPSREPGHGGYGIPPRWGL